jgi:7-alpha-hydroxysteroid dehydrogenase
LESMIQSNTPMARLGQPEDVAACVLYLASPAAGYVTGEILGVNGGVTRSPTELRRTQF